MEDLRHRIAKILKNGEAATSKELEDARNALKQAINSLSSEIGILRRERWTYERTCVSLPPRLNDESIDVRIDVTLEGRLDLLVDGDKIQGLNSLDGDSISRLITGLGNASIKDLRIALLEDNDGETTEDDISTEEISRETRIVPSFGENLADIYVSNTRVHLKEDKSQSVEIDVILCDIDVDDDLDELTDSTFCIGCPFADSEEAEDILENTDALGELAPLWQWIPSTLSADIGDVPWAEWFASKICPIA